MTKSLTRTDDSLTIVIYMFALQGVIGLLPALQVWVWPSAEKWPWVLALGLAGTASHFCLAKAITSADATVVMPMDFLRVPVTAVAGWLLYSEGIDAFLVAGAALILLGNANLNCAACRRMSRIRRPGPKRRRAARTTETAPGSVRPARPADRGGQARQRAGAQP
jgi:uncharacterized membrane protein